MHYKNVIFGSASTLSVVNAMSTLNQDSSFELNSSRTAPIGIVDSKFFNSQTGEQFFLKGLTYQPIIVTEPFLCLGDPKFFEKLNLDTTRVYSIDNERSHDVRMEALADKGIYILADLSDKEKSIQRDLPSWDIRLFKTCAAVVSAMQKYPNILGFFAGTEVTNDSTNTDASFIKAGIGDIKEYIQENEYRQIPVRYSSNDDTATREYLAKYFACDGEEVADFYGITMYEWCRYSSCVNSGYREGTLETTNHPIPIFSSESGYNAIRPRPSAEVPEMSKIWSGNLAHMYFEEDDGYGSTKIDGFGSVHKLEDFKYLQNAYNIIMSCRTTKKKYLQDANFEITSQFARRPNEVSTQQARQSWKASTKLPMTHNAKICHWLEQELPYLATSFLSGRNFQDHLDYACGQVDCSDIAAEGDRGRCGEFSYCLPEQKLVLESSEIYNTEKNHLAGVCPMKGNNVSFNRNSLNLTDPRCAEISQKSKLAKKKPKLFGIDSGSPTTKFKHSGYALLLVSFIFATIVF